jgi:hypothetical protein
VYILKALKFALLGDANITRKYLFNFWHLKECEKNGKMPFCEVEVEIEHKETSYLFTGRLEYADFETMKQTMVFDKNLG